jgi:hypothetical protein
LCHSCLFAANESIDSCAPRRQQLLEIERGSGSGSLVTLLFGSRAKAIVNSYSERNVKKAG